VTSFLNSGSAAPFPGGALEGLVRRVQDLERGYAAMQTLLVNAGTLQVNDPNSGNRVFFVGEGGMNDGSGRMQAVVDLSRQDGTAALQLADDGTAPGHTIQQALQWFDRDGNTVAADDTLSGQGLARPYIPVGFFTDNTVPTSTTTSTTFTTLQTLVGYKQHPKVAGQILVYADAGTTGAIQLVDQSSNVLFTSTLISGQFNYVPFGPVAIAGTHELPISLNIQGKVLTGAGKVGARGVAAIGVQS
jgi:hypothetical protein